jgi:hypothetical protein
VPVRTLLKKEAACSSETSVDFQQTTRGYIPEDRRLYNHLCENLRSYKSCNIFRTVVEMNILVVAMLSI